jgi:hypothetical protein
MSKFHYELYCDESGTDKNNFCFGAIHCTPARADILDRKVQDFRAKTGLIHELKWTKVSKTLLPEYTEFVDIFLDDHHATFRLSRISKGEHWRKLANSNDSRFLHAYFHFIEQVMWASARYAIFLDETTSKSYKFKSFHYALNLPNIVYHQQKKVYKFKIVSSSNNNLIQLVDVVLGALASQPIAPHKVALSNYIQEKIRKNGKLIAYDWIAPETRRFKPRM